LGESHQVALRALDANLIGRPVAASAVMLCHGHESWHPNPAFFYQPGAGPLLDMGPYYLTALVSLMGSVVSVQGAASVTFAEREILSEPLKGARIAVEVPTHVAGLLEFESGAIATLVTSFDVWDSKTPHLEIHGSLGSIVLPNPNWFDGEVLISRSEDRTWRALSPHVEEPVDRRGLGLVDLVDAIRLGREPRLSGSLGLHVLEVMDAIASSAESGQRVGVTSRIPDISLRTNS
jgi:predicted dehydrogenase